jgi:hypothetical protein
MLGKEAALTLPLVALWIDFLFGRDWVRWPGQRHRGWWRDLSLYPKLLRDHSPFILASALYVGMRVALFLTEQGRLGYGEGQLGFFRDLAHSLNVVTGYLFMALGLWWVPQELLAWETWVKLLILSVALLAVILLVRWLGRVALFGIGWTVLTLLLTLQAVAPRWFYVPALGVGIVTAAVWARLRQMASSAKPAARRTLYRALSAAPLALLVGWSILTTVHNELWRQSGEEARRLLGEVRALHPSPALPATFYVANPPYSYKGVLLFNSGFDTSINLAYRNWSGMRAYNLAEHIVPVRAALADPENIGPNPVFLRYENGHMIDYPSLDALAQADRFPVAP